MLSWLFRGASPQSQHSSYRRDIDGLRAIAVTSVLLNHCGVPGFSGGYVGVDVFFIISGYLIGGNIASEVAANKFSLVKFYARRARRILPALLSVLIATWAAAVFLSLPSHLLSISSSLVAAAASFSNIYFWQKVNYFDTDSASQPLLHTWSLSIEEQFYVVIPLLMLITTKWIRLRWNWVLTLICVASFALSIYCTRDHAVSNFYLLPNRAWELALGCLLATLPLRLSIGRASSELIGLGGLALIAVPVVVFSAATSFPGVNAIYPCLGACLLIYIGGTARPTAIRMLSTLPFVGIGLISYSIYLIHWPIISLLRYRSADFLSSTQIIEVCLASLLLAYLSWRFIEQPFRRPAPTARSVPVVLLASAAIAVTCIFGVITKIGHGFPSRFPDYAEAGVIPGEEQWKTDRCFLVNDIDYKNWSLPDCTRITSGSHKVLLWGDSFAAQYTPGILENAGLVNATIIQYTAAGCLPLLFSKSYPDHRCQAFNNHVLSIIDRNNIDTIVMAGRWSHIVNDRQFKDLATTLRILGKKQLNLTVIGQSPEFSSDVRDLSFLKGSRSNTAVNRWKVSFDRDLNETLLSIVGSKNFINPMAVLCSDDVCTYQDHGKFLFMDNGHYSAVGSDRVVENIFNPSTMHPSVWAAATPLADEAAY